MIREAFIRMEEESIYQKYIKNILDENFSDYIFDINEEGSSLQKEKDKICTLIKPIEDKDVLSDVQNALRKPYYLGKITEIGNKKDLDEKTMTEFSRYFFTTEGSAEEKTSYLELLSTKGILKGKGIIKSTSIGPLLSPSLMNGDSKFIRAITPRLYSWIAYLGARSGVGAGEGLLSLYVKDAGKASVGDLLISNKKVEVKANKSKSYGGRLQGTTGAWAGGGSKRKQMLEIIEPFAKGKLVKDKNGYNFGLWSDSKGKSKMNNWNNILVGNNIDKSYNKAVAIDILTKVFKLIFTSASDFSWLDSALDTDGSMNQNFPKEFGVFQFKYYQNQEGFDSILFMNADNGNFININNPNEYKSALKNNYINLGGGLSWNDDRAIAFQ